MKATTAATIPQPRATTAARSISAWRSPAGSRRAFRVKRGLEALAALSVYPLGPSSGLGGGFQQVARRSAV